LVVEVQVVVVQAVALVLEDLEVMELQTLVAVAVEEFPLAVVDLAVVDYV
jgi:hypothetical protein